MFPMSRYHFKEFERKNVDGTTSKVVVALSKHRGKYYRGVAKCVSTDNYSLESGKELAAARCNYKVCYKKKCDLEKHKIQVAKHLEELNEYYIKLCKRCGEVTLETIEASKHLSEIEEKLA